MTGVPIRRRTVRHRYRKKTAMQRQERRFRIMQPQTKGYLRLLEAGKGKEGSSPTSFVGSTVL